MTPEARARRIATARAYALAHPEKAREATRKSYQKHKEQRKTASLAYYHANRERLIEANKSPHRKAAKQRSSAAHYLANRENLLAKAAERRDEKKVYNREYRSANREHLLVKDRKRYASKKETMKAYSAVYRSTRREEAKARTREWKAANPDLAKDISRRCGANWYLKNRARKLAANARWRRANPDLIAAHARNRYARAKGAAGKITPTDVAMILAMQRDRCAYCRVKLSRKFHIDHIIALKVGGDHQRANLQALCPSCNQRKGTKHPLAFAREIGLLL